MSEELKPCPFCGGVAKEYVGVAPEDWVECIHCGARTLMGNEKDVIRLWNTRQQVSEKDIVEILGRLHDPQFCHTSNIMLAKAIAKELT